MVAPWSVRVIAVLLALVSAMVVWSECLFFIKNPVLSIFALFLDVAKQHYTYATIEVS
jgi:LMBR1-like membrane protein